MFITKEKIPVILNEYLQKVMLPKSPSSSHSFFSGIAIGFGIRKANALLSDPKIISTLTTLGIADSMGRINLDELRNVVNDALKVSGTIAIPVINYNIDSSDFQSIFEIARQYATGDVNESSENSSVPRSSF